MFELVENLQYIPLHVCSSKSDSSFFLHAAKSFADSRSAKLESRTTQFLLNLAGSKIPPLVAPNQTGHACISIVYGHCQPKYLELLHSPTEHGWWIPVLLYIMNIYLHGLPFF